MILYGLVDGDVHTRKVKYRPRNCFLMTQLGGTVPEEVDSARQDLKHILDAHNIALIDANSEITGRDFLIKIWNMIVAVPLAIAIVHEDMPTTTQCNVFYEVGIAQSLGKETLVIKTKEAKVPSDFVRTEYIEYGEDFEQRIAKYLTYFFERAEYFVTMADQLENNPLASIDYLRRAYLITGDEACRKEAEKIIEFGIPEGRAKTSVDMMLADF
jgi:hypothetical protein